MHAVDGTKADAILDVAALETMRSCDPTGNMTRKFIQVFLTDAPEKVAAIEAAVHARATEQVAQLAHSLKSHAGWLGGRSFTGVCQRLEHHARAGSPEGCQQHLPELKHQLPLLLEDLLRYSQRDPKISGGRLQSPPAPLERPA